MWGEVMAERAPAARKAAKPAADAAQTTKTVGSGRAGVRSGRTGTAAAGGLQISDQAPPITARSAAEGATMTKSADVS